MDRPTDTTENIFFPYYFAGGKITRNENTFVMVSVVTTTEMRITQGTSGALRTDTTLVITTSRLTVTVIKTIRVIKVLVTVATMGRSMEDIIPDTGEAYNPGHQGGYGYGRPRNPYQNWTNDFPERQFGHQHHHGAYSVASTRGAPPPPHHDPYWHSPNNQRNGAFDNESRRSSSSHSRPPMNNHHPHGERSYGRSWSGPSSRGHHGSSSPNGRSNRKFNPYATYNGQ